MLPFHFIEDSSKIGRCEVSLKEGEGDLWSGLLIDGGLDGFREAIQGSAVDWRLGQHHLVCSLSYCGHLISLRTGWPA